MKFGIQRVKKPRQYKKTKTIRYRLSEQAERDLEDILVEGILTFGSLQDHKYQESFKRTFELLAYMPTIGRKSERGCKNEHCFLHGSHVLYFRIDPNEIITETIIHGVIITELWGGD
jgi:toxin ParE1/3/4